MPITNQVRGGGAQYITGDPYFDSVTLLLNCDQDPPTDYSPLAHTPSVVDSGSGMALNTSFEKFGTGCLSKGSNESYINVPNHAGFQMGDSAFTMEVWMRPGSLGINDDPDIISLGGGFPASNRGYWLSIFNHTSIVFNFSLNGTSWAGDLLFDTSMGSYYAANTWAQYTVSRDADGVLYYFANGVLRDTYDLGSSVINASTSDLKFGFNDSGAGTPNAQAFDEIRFTKGVCRYTENFNVQDAAWPLGKFV